MDVQKIEKYLEQIVKNDITALENLYNETRSYVFRFAFSIMKNKEEAEDIMQDTYININKYASNYDAKTKPMSWILTITKNLCFNKLKKQKRNNNMDITELEETLVTNNDNAFDKVLVQNIIESLNDEERQIFVLHSIEDFKFKEIGKMLDMKLSTVLSKYHRALKKVRENYGKDGVN